MSHKQIASIFLIPGRLARRPVILRGALQGAPRRLFFSILYRSRAETRGAAPPAGLAPELGRASPPPRDALSERDSLSTFFG